MSKARTRSHSLVFVLGVAIAVSCRPATVDNGVTQVRSALTTVTFSLPLFVGENPSDVALAASSSLSVNDRAIALELATNDRALVSNTGTTDLSTVIGASSSVGTVLSGGQVFLRINASVSGSLYQGGNTAGPQTQGSFFVSGVTKPHVARFAADGTWTRTVTWPTTIGTPPNLDSGGLPPNVRLTPNVAYPNLDVHTGRTLIFDPGEYFLDGLTVEPDAFLDIEAGSGPVFVYIRDGAFIFRGRFAPGHNTVGMPVPSLTVMTTGSVDLEQPFTGVIIAPNGYINLKANVNTNDPKSHLGAYLAKTVTLFEGNRVFHYRDPFSFQHFAPGGGTPFIGERASVTGGSIRLPAHDATDEAHQSEAVTAITRINNNPGASTYVVTVGYNDQTVTVTNPTILYKDTINDPRDGTTRWVKKGTSLMGWSYSTDNGRTFTYGGRVAPPTGWSIIWGDPALAKSVIDDAFVYYAQLAGTTTKFESAWDSSKQAIVSDSTAERVGGALDGYCISKSVDRGVTFTSIGCLRDVLQDGTALAATVDQNGKHQVYVAGSARRVWRMDGDTMTFASSKLADPFNLPPDRIATGHPRMAVFNNILYYVQRTEGLQAGGSQLRASRLNAATNATTWLGDVDVVPAAGTAITNKATTFPQFSFDIGPGVDGTSKFRVIYPGGSKPSNPGNGGLTVTECNLDLTGCQTLGWSTQSEPGVDAGFSIRSSGGQWAATWRREESVGGSTLVRMMAAHLVLANGVATLDERTIYPDVDPCTFDFGTIHFWGDYNLVGSFGDGRFFAPYTVNGPGCRWKGMWTSDAHVGGSVVQF